MESITLNEASKVHLPMKPAVLEQYDQLSVGESIIVKNTHNPYLLYYQLLEDRGTTFAWNLLEKGPKIWRVKITKLRNMDAFQTIGEIAVKDYRKAELFRRFGIDYCCNGSKTLEQACNDAGISARIWNELYIEAIQYSDKEIYPFDTWEVDFLVDYIINTHHYYIKQNAELISRLAFKVTSRHQFANPELKSLSARLDYFLDDLQAHVKKEEQVLFPSIKKLIINKRKKKVNMPAVDEIIGEKTVREYEEAHKGLGESLRFFKNITHNYKLPEDACLTYTHLFAKLLEFENDLVQHIHLENNVLFPKVAALRKELLNL